MIGQCGLLTLASDFTHNHSSLPENQGFLVKLTESLNILWILRLTCPGEELCQSLLWDGRGGKKYLPWT